MGWFSDDVDLDRMSDRELKDYGDRLRRELDEDRELFHAVAKWIPAFYAFMVLGVPAIIMLLVN